MALKQNAPEIALEVLSTLQKQYFINVRCLKLLAYMKLHNYIHIIPLIKKTLERDMDGNVKHTYFADVVCKICNCHFQVLLIALLEFTFLLTIY